MVKRNLLAFTAAFITYFLSLLTVVRVYPELPVPAHEAESDLIALFDYPLHVCSWLAQMKAVMWVRNGLGLRHQMRTYRGVSQQDLAHHRHIFLLQTAVCIWDTKRVLASMIELYGMNDWMRRDISHWGWLRAWPVFGCRERLYTFDDRVIK